MSVLPKHFIKMALSKLLPDNVQLRYLSYIACLESWRKRHTEKFPVFSSKFDLYKHVNSNTLHNCTINYLEFGVFKGETINSWRTINSNADSKFVGFDTFSGLPEEWKMFSGKMDKGYFNLNGNTPQVDDKRVSFVKGLFQDTLPGFLEDFKIQSQLVIHNDSDLYSSTLYMLTCCNDILVQGSIVIFDEFASILNEFRALEDYCSSYQRNYEVIGATKSKVSYYSQIAIRMK